MSKKVVRVPVGTLKKVCTCKAGKRFVQRLLKDFGPPSKEGVLSVAWTKTLEKELILMGGGLLSAAEHVVPTRPPHHKGIIFLKRDFKKDRQSFGEEDLSYAKFSKLNLHTMGAYKCDLRYATFHRCILTNSRFIGCDLEGAEFVDCGMDNVAFTHSSVKGVKFVRCKLTKAEMRSVDADSTFWERCEMAEFRSEVASFRYSKFCNCILPSSRFQRTIWEGAELLSVYANNATFANSSFRDASFERSDFTGTTLTKLDLRGSRFSNTSLQGALADKSTFDSLPEGVMEAIPEEMYTLIRASKV